jgi:MtfA peptidase
MPEHWWKTLRERFLEPPPIPDPLWRRALGHCPLANRLDADRQQQLRQLAALFLSRKHFHALAGAVLDDYWRLLITMQACLPALQQGPAALSGWREVLVYPGELRVRRGHGHEVAGAPGAEKSLLCDLWEHGPLVLSLADVQLDLEQPWDGCNVVVHEMAHKLDMLDGPPDGVPPLTNISRRRWIVQFQQAYERAVHPAADHDSLIDRHAAENPSEYFAVASELHYSQPALLREAEPEIADLLEAFYGRSPGYEN